MKSRKTRIIMGILVGLVLFSSSTALLLYLKQNNKKKSSQESIEVFVAAKNLKIGDLLDAHAITKAKFPKSHVSFIPLRDSEIMHRYARVDIYKDEPIRTEKISATKPVEQKYERQHIRKNIPLLTALNSSSKINQITQDTISVSLSLFKNNYTLLSTDDYVDIVTAIPSDTKKSNESFHTKFIALHVKIVGFLSHTKAVKTMIIYNEKQQPVKADTIVLVMSPKEIKNFLAVYYKTQQLNNNRVYNTNNYGGQLWLIKTPKVIDEKIYAQKKHFMVDQKKYKKSSFKRKEKVDISYEK